MASAMPPSKPFMQASNDRDDWLRTPNEAAARAALEVRAGRGLTDAEWSAARTRFLEFVEILRIWQPKDERVQTR